MTKSSRLQPLVAVFALPALVAAGSARLVAAAPATPRVEVQSHPDDRRVDVLVDGQPFTAYVWPERLAKPVLYPIRTAAGTLVTRGFPLDPRPGERVDHPHHVGLWFNHGDVNGVDFWNNSEAQKPEERAKMGTIRHVAIESAKGGAGSGELKTASDWIMPDGSTAIHEKTGYVFGAAAGRRSIDRETTLTAGDRRVVFTDNKEGTLGLRVTRALEAPSKEPLVFTDASGKPTAVPALDNAGVNGLYTSSEGLTGDAVWGTRGRWVALAGKVGPEDVVLLILDHPKNPGHPSYWHARGYGLFAANPLGAKVLSNGKDQLNLTLEPGQAAHFRHRLLILAGAFSKEKAEAAWQEFAAETAR
jgi:hypothetical protein